MTTYDFTHIGISGCNLQLIDRQVLRKISPSVNYNYRLQQQYKKQLFFNSLSSSVNVPTVFDTGYINDVFYFDMQYIDGKLFHEEFQKVSKYTLDIYISKILSHISYCKHLNIGYKEIDTKSAVINKIVSLQQNTNYPDLVRYLIEFVYNKNFPSLWETICHGDLTLSNVLFKNGEIYLLDFLDSYIESYVMDIVKLKQDLVYGWSSNLLNIDSTYTTRTEQIFLYIWNKIEQEHADIINTDLFNVLDLLNFLRIEPYVKTQLQKDTLFHIIRKTKIYEEFNSANDGKVNQIPKPSSKVDANPS